MARDDTPPSSLHEAVIGVLAAAGMRVGEALQLDRGDVAEPTRQAGDDPAAVIVCSTQ
jgi:integrase